MRIKKKGEIQRGLGKLRHEKDYGVGGKVKKKYERERKRSGRVRMRPKGGKVTKIVSLNKICQQCREIGYVCVCYVGFKLG